MENKATVAKRDPYEAGHCQGCNSPMAAVFEINARGWITRFCWYCLQDLVRQAREQR